MLAQACLCRLCQDTGRQTGVVTALTDCLGSEAQIKTHIASETTHFPTLGGKSNLWFSGREEKFSCANGWGWVVHVTYLCLRQQGYHDRSAESGRGVSKERPSSAANNSMKT